MSKKRRRLLREISIANECIRALRHATEAQRKYFEFMKLVSDQGPSGEAVQYYVDADGRNYILR